MLKHLLLTSLLSTALLLPRTEVLASPPVRMIPTVQAQGRSGSLPTILVWAGSGTNLSFLPTGEQIQRVWLDDPSQITLDFDAPLCQGREGRACGRSSATIVHLRRINPLNWAGLPRASSTLLTVITDGATGRQLYQFRVAYGSGTPEYTTLEVRPTQINSASAPVSRARTRVAEAPLINLPNIERGLRVAIQRRFVRSNSPIVPRLSRFLLLSHSGIEIPLAAQQAGISMTLVSKLASLGSR